MKINTNKTLKIILIKNNTSKIIIILVKTILINTSKNNTN